MFPESEKYTYRVLWSEEDKEFIGLCAGSQAFVGSHQPLKKH